MAVHDFFLSLLIILLTARLFAEIFARLKTPAVLGELLAGVVLGPSLLGWIEPFDAIHLMAQIGLILLLFEVGLETDLRRLVSTGIQSAQVAIAGFVLPFLAGFVLSFYLFDFSMLAALFVGGTLTATSIGITVRVLGDLRIQHGKVGQIVLGAAVLDDVLGVVLLALLYEFSIGGGVSFLNAAKIFIFIGVFFAIAPVAAKLLSLVLNRLDRDSAMPGLIPTTIVSLVLFFAWLAHSIGVPELLGGFAAGLAMSRRFFLPFGIALRHDEDFSQRIETQMKPITYLFKPIFFVVVGLSLNLRDIDWSSPFIWAFSLLLLLVAVLGKLMGAFVIAESWPARLMTGLAMIPRGEVGLVFSELGREADIFSNEIYAGLIIVITITTLLSPFIMKWYSVRYRWE